jgi:large subunit ribosomal protein L17
MLRNLAAGLFEHGEIVTTLQKAKAVQPFVERLVTIAKRGDLHSRRLVTARLGGDRRAFVWLTEDKIAAHKQDNPYWELPDSDQVEFNRYGEVRKAPSLVKHICETVAPRFTDRDGGYTRIIRLGTSRLGDAGEKVLLQFVGEEEGPELSGAGSRRREIANRRAEFAAKFATAGAPAETAAPPADEPEPEATEAEAPEAPETDEQTEEKSGD